MARPAFMPLISVEAVTALDRQATIDAVREAITATGGWIEDFRLFSNISVMIRSSLPARNAAQFGRALEAIGLNLPPEAIAAFAARADQEAGDREFACTLNLTFVHNDRDLRIEAPAVPG